jgi:hypothetical protein
MDTQRIDHPAVRDLRRYQLAMRLVAHQARTQTICDLTGYTRHRLTTLRRRWRVPAAARHRGPPPQSVTIFFRSPRLRSEATVVAALCHFTGAIPHRPRSTEGQDFPPRDADKRLATGERLCDAFEAYRACFPESGFEFDHVVLLAKSLVHYCAIRLGSCTKCEGTLLIDRLETRRQICSQCHPSADNKLAHDPDGSGAPQSQLVGVQTTLFCR